MEGAGGTQAAAVGQGGLLAARTGNAGAGAESISDASRGAGEQLSKNLLGIRSQNAALKERQRESATSGLTNTLALETNAGNTALGQIAPLVNANTEAAKNDPWNQFFSGLAGDGSAATIKGLTTP